MDGPNAESTHTEIIQLRYGDLDTLGHVNSVIYFSFLETARWGFFRDLGFDPVDAFLVAHSECDYIAEIPATARTITVETWSTGAGRTSIAVKHRILHDGRVRARGAAVMVRIDEAQRPRPLTPSEREALLRYPGIPDELGTDEGADPVRTLPSQ